MCKNGCFVKVIDLDKWSTVEYSVNAFILPVDMTVEEFVEKIFRHVCKLHKKFIDEVMKFGCLIDYEPQHFMYGYEYRLYRDVTRWVFKHFDCMLKFTIRATMLRHGLYRVTICDDRDMLCLSDEYTLYVETDGAFMKEHAAKLLQTHEVQKALSECLGTDVKIIPEGTEDYDVLMLATHLATSELIQYCEYCRHLLPRIGWSTGMLLATFAVCKSTPIHTLL